MARITNPEEYAMIENANAIIDACLGVRSEVRADGYQNMLTKYGTKADTSTAYRFIGEDSSDNYTLAINYQYNGLFTKIIDLPSEEAVAKGFKLNVDDPEIEKSIINEFNKLDWEEKFGEALKWARLFGGALAVMVINDGRGLDEPLNFKAIRGIEEIRVYESAIVNPVAFVGINMEHPEMYQVSSIYGTFNVHHTRCLVIKNGKLPEIVNDEINRYWGANEYDRIRTSLRETVVSHGMSPKLLERAAQSVFGIKNLAELLSTQDGEDAVVRRLRAIDMSRSMFNSIALDADGETFNITSSPFTGVREVIDSTYNMLSAVTNIPQTLLFGNSPQGMNATGHSDLENYYNYIGQIQKKMLKKPLKRLTDIIIKSMCATGKLQDVPDYELEFNPLWSLSEIEQAQVDSMKAQAELTRAQIASAYVQIGALDPTEVRAALASSAEYDIETILDNVPEDEFFEDLLKRAEEGQQQGGGEDPMAAMAGMGGMPGMGGEIPAVPTGDVPQVPTGEAKVPQVPQGPEAPKAREDDKSDEGRWVTTEEGHHVHFNGEGKPDKGNPHVLEMMTGSSGKVGGSSSDWISKIEADVSKYGTAQIPILERTETGLSPKFKLEVDKNLEKEIIEKAKEKGYGVYFKTVSKKEKTARRELAYGTSQETRLTKRRMMIAYKLPEDEFSAAGSSVMEEPVEPEEDFEAWNNARLAREKKAKREAEKNGTEEQKLLARFEKDMSKNGKFTDVGFTLNIGRAVGGRYSISNYIEEAMESDEFEADFNIGKAVGFEDAMKTLGIEETRPYTEGYKVTAEKAVAFYEKYLQAQKAVENGSGDKKKTEAVLAGYKEVMDKLKGTSFEERYELYAGWRKGQGDTGTAEVLTEPIKSRIQELSEKYEEEVAEREKNEEAERQMRRYAEENGYNPDDYVNYEGPPWNEDGLGVDKLKNPDIINSDGAPYGNDNAAKDHIKKIGAIVSKKELTDKLASGELSKKVRKNANAVHTYGSDEYEKRVKSGRTPSTLSLSPAEQRKFIDEAIDKGIVFKTKSGGLRAFYKSKEYIGIVVDPKGKGKRTNSGVVHFSKKGAHIVPSEWE